MFFKLFVLLLHATISTCDTSGLHRTRVKIGVIIHMDQRHVETIVQQVGNQQWSFLWWMLLVISDLSIFFLSGSEQIQLGICVSCDWTNFCGYIYKWHIVKVNKQWYFILEIPFLCFQYDISVSSCGGRNCSIVVSSSREGIWTNPLSCLLTWYSVPCLGFFRLDLKTVIKILDTKFDH